MELNKYERGTIRIEIQSLKPEKFINLLWKNNVLIKNINKLNITTMTMDISLRDFTKIDDLARKSGTKIRVIERKGFSFLMLRLRKHFTLVGGILIFAAGIYYLSTYIWKIEITADKHLTPYEIRRKLYSYGIRPGIAKKNLDVYALQDKLQKDNDDIMWNRIRIEGSTLKVDVLESTTPPNIVSDNEPCDIVSNMDGEIVSVYTTAGTAAVKPGQIVKNGQILIRGSQGKDGNTYQVHASGQVVAKTFYETLKQVQIKGTKNERTGNKSTNTYIEIAGKKIYLKKGLNKFANYDKIENNKGLIKQETFYETKVSEFALDKDTVVKQTVDNFCTSTKNNLDKSAKILDKQIVEVEPVNDSIKIRVVLVVEQAIGVQSKLQQ